MQSGFSLQPAVLNMRQPADRNPGNQIGQFIDERLVDRHPKRILRKEFAVSHKNVALPHQAYRRTESRAILCARWQKAPYDIERGREV